MPEFSPYVSIKRRWGGQIPLCSAVYEGIWLFREYLLLGDLLQRRCDVCVSFLGLTIPTSYLHQPSFPRHSVRSPNRITRYQRDEVSQGDSGESHEELNSPSSYHYGTAVIRDVGTQYICDSSQLCRFEASHGQGEEGEYAEEDFRTSVMALWV